MTHSLNCSNMQRACLPVRVMAAVFVANILSMWAMNLLVLPSDLLALVFTVSLLIAVLLVRNLTPIDLSADHPVLERRDMRLVAAVSGALCVSIVLSRTSYLLEPLFKMTLDPVCWDDYWHIQELSSLTNTERFPPVSSFDNTLYFAFYYAPWMLIVFIHKLLPAPLSTIKLAYFIGHSLYTVLIVYFVLFTCFAVSRSRKQYLFLLYAVLLYAGVESLLFVVSPGRHHEWWMRDLFGVQVQISSFSTLAVLVIHHLSAAAAVILAALTYATARPKGAADVIRNAVLIGALLAYALYSSIFVVLGAFPFLVFMVCRSASRDSAMRRWAFWIVIFSLVFAGPMLWMYLPSSSRAGFIVFGHVRDVTRAVLGVSIPVLNWASRIGVFVLLISLELVLYVAIHLLSFRRIMASRDDLVMSLIGWTYIFSTCVIKFSGANNYAMRGAIVPVFVLAWVSSRQFEHIKVKPAAWGLALLLALGTANEIVGANARNMLNLLPCGKVKQVWLGKSDKIGAEIRRTVHTYNTRRDIGTIAYDSLNNAIKSNLKEGYLFYLFEKRIIGMPQRQVQDPDSDSELISPGPVGPWAYQDWIPK